MSDFARLLVCFSSPRGVQSIHTIFCKRHSVRQASDKTPNGLTLFTLGWPPYCGSDMVREIFSRVGEVRVVYMSARPGQLEKERCVQERGTVGYVVFSETGEVDSALKMCNLTDPIPCTYTGDYCGVRKWCREYVEQRKSVSSLESLVEQVVSQYELKKEQKKSAREKAGQEDEEGWITVTRKRAMPAGQQGKKKKRKKAKELVNFYNFQQRETQREKIAELRKKFEEDKRRVALMRERRKFKPY